MKRLVLLALLAAAAVSAFDVASARAATDVRAVTFNGRAANVYFFQVDQANCVYTYFQNSAFSGRATESRVGSTKQVNLVAYIDTVNICDPAGPQETFLECLSDSASINIDRSLSTATLNGTLTCTNDVTGATCELAKSETLQGTGTVTTTRLHYQYRFGGHFFDERIRGSVRDAQVTSASITGCGVSLTEQDAQAANLASVISGSITVSRL